MRFFSTAFLLSAIAGSALALPHDSVAPWGKPKAEVEVEVEGRSESVPSGAAAAPSWVSSWGPPSVSTIATYTQTYTAATATSTAVTKPVGDVSKGGENAVSGGGVVVVVEAVLVTILEVKSLVLADIEVVLKLVDAVDIDTKALVSALHSLETHLAILLKVVVPKLVALVIEVGALAEADLKAVLSLLVEIKAVLAAVLSLLVHIVATLKADVLVLVVAEVQGILALVTVIVGPILNIALTAVVGLEVTLGALVKEILVIVADISKISVDLGDVLKPVLTVVLGAL